MINDLVKENERVDDLQNGYYIIQDPRKFCFGMDAVLLSGFARVKKGEKVLYMGTGTGITWPQIVCIYYCFLYFALSFATEFVAGFWLLS